MTMTFQIKDITFFHLPNVLMDLYFFTAFLFSSHCLIMNWNYTIFRNTEQELWKKSNDSANLISESWRIIMSVHFLLFLIFSFPFRFQYPRCSSYINTGTIIVLPLVRWVLYQTVQNIIVIFEISSGCKYETLTSKAIFVPNNEYICQIRRCIKMYFILKLVWLNLLKLRKFIRKIKWSKTS